MKLIIIIIFILSFSSFASDFEVITTPENSDVYLQINPKDKPIKMGRTPLKLDTEEVYKYLNGNKTYIIDIKKDGFDDYKIMMVRSEDVSVKLDVLLEVTSEIKTIKKHDILMSNLFKVQRLIRSNNFDDAIDKLNNLEKDYSDFSIISELKGITYYMKKDVNKALSMFRLAFSKNPQNSDAYKMKIYLEKKLGIDAEVN